MRKYESQDVEDVFDQIIAQRSGAMQQNTPQQVVTKTGPLVEAVRNFAKKRKELKIPNGVQPPR